MKTNTAILLPLLSVSFLLSVTSAADDRAKSSLFAEGTGPVPPLAAAAEAGSLKDVKRLLAAGEDPNARTGDQATNGALIGGITPLYAAAVRGHVEIVQALLDGGADIRRATTANGRTPLFEIIHAIKDDGKLNSMAKLLLERGADPNQPNAKVGSTLHFAVLLEKPGIVRQLMTAGAKLDSKTRDGQTPLELARERNLTEMVKLLSELASSEPARRRDR